MSGDHDHCHAARRAGARHSGRLTLAFALVGAYFVIEAVTGLLTNSLALLSDAGHMFTDVLSLGMALAAIRFASRASADAQRTYGLYRLEILAALANAVLLFGVAGYVLYEAVRRIGEPPEVISGVMLAVAVAGLAVNLVCFFVLRKGAAESLNVKGAHLEVVSDALGSVGVIVAGAVIELTGWRVVDPIVAAGIGVFILPRTWRLGRQAVRILVQAAPPDIRLEDVRADLGAVPGVVDVHDLHLWTLTSDMEVASAHLMVAAGTDSHGVLDEASRVLRERYQLVHATLQVEPDDHTGCDQVTW